MMIADSDILIDYLRGREPGHGRIRLEVATGHLATTAINSFELLSGVTGDGSRKKVSSLLAALHIVPFDAKAGEHAAEVRRQLEAEGKPIGTADYLIAGVCLAQSATLLTRNRSHFARVPGLRLGIEAERA